MATTKQVLKAANPLELGQWATAFGVGAHVALTELERSFWVSVVNQIEAERVERGLCPIHWGKQAERELQFSLAQQSAKESGPKPVHLNLDGATPEEIRRAAELLSRAARMAIKQGQEAIGGILGGVALALDAQLPSRPGRRRPMAN